MLNNSPSTYKKFDKFGSQKFQPARSQLVINLRKLVDSMEIDLLAASLGIRESMLRDILSGKDNGNDYRQFLSQKLDDAGFSHNWLDRVNAPIYPDQLKELRNLASNSNQKAPLRRDNLKILMNSFDGKLDVLADALEVVPNALFKVSQGELMMDDQRFGHFNPILMRAGFPDGWLELPQAPLEENWIDELTRMANDQYEEYLSKLEDIPSKALPIVTAPSIAPVVFIKPPHLEEKFRMVTAVHPVNPITSDLSGKAPPVFRSKSAENVLNSIAEAALSPIKENKEIPKNFESSTPKEPLVVPTAIAKKIESAQKEAKQTSPANISALRTQRLEKLMSQARRGARSHLWLTCLNKSMALSYNLESGKSVFTDELANQVTEALGLPQGWLDQENGNPLLAAAWLFDKTISLKLTDPRKQDAETPTASISTLPPPVKKISQLKADTKESGEVRNLESDLGATGVKLLTSISENQLSSTRGRARLKVTEARLGAPVEYTLKQEDIFTENSPALEPVTSNPLPVPTVAEVAALPVPSPVFPRATTPVKPVEDKPTPIAVSLPSNPSVLGELGPLAKVLLHTIELQARLGKLSEQQALEIIYKIS